MVRALRSITEIVAAIILASIVAVIFAQVISRYVLELSISWPEELARYLLVWLVFIGGAAAVGAGEQLVVDTLTELAPLRLRRPARFIAPVGGLLGVGVLIYACLPLLFGPASRTTSPATDIPLGWVYLALPVGSVLAGIFLINSLYETIRYPGKVEEDAVEGLIRERADG